MNAINFLNFVNNIIQWLLYLVINCWVCVRVVARTTVITTSRLTMMNGSQVLRKPPQLKKEGR